jgi:hypothetical protein
METHLSLMLLVSASLLISAFSISTGQHHDGGKNLFELRTIQAGCIASCILVYEMEAGRGPFIHQLSDDELPLCIIWTGSDALVLEGGPLDDGCPLMEVLARTPDGLGCLVLIGPEDDMGPDIGGSAVLHRCSIDDERSLTVALPLVRGGASYKEVVI